MGCYVNLTCIGYVFFNIMHLLTNAVEFAVGYFMYKNFSFPMYPQPFWAPLKFTTMAMGITFMVFAVIQTLLVILNFGFMARENLWTVGGGNMLLMMLGNTILLFMSIAYQVMHGTNYNKRMPPSHRIDIGKCVKRMYHQTGVQVAYCDYFYIILILMYEITLEFCIILACFILQHYYTRGITLEGCCEPGDSDEDIVVVSPYPPPVVVLPYGPPPQYVAPPGSPYGPPPRGQYPPPQGQYPPQGPYPPPGQHPPPPGQHPPPPGQHPPPPGQHPPPPGQYPPPPGQYPPPHGQHPPPQGQYPPQQQGNR